jgi:hypothetical protein
MRVSTVEQPARTKALSAVPGMSRLGKELTLHYTVKIIRSRGCTSQTRALLD